MFFFFKDAVPAGAVLHRSLQDGGNPPAGQVLTTGWVPGNNAQGMSCLQNGGSKVPRADPSWGTTLQPSAPPSQTRGDCWRSENRITGIFDAGEWNFVFGVRSVTAAYTGRLKLGVRLWRSADPNGVGAVELTSGRVSGDGTNANLSLSANAQLNVDWISAAPKTLANEYLFFNVGMQIVTQPGTGTTQDVVFFIGTGTSLGTPNLTAPSRSSAVVMG